MVIFTDGLFPGPGAFVFTNSPLPVSLGLLEHNPSGLEKQCQAVPKALLALRPISTAGQMALLSPHPPTVQLQTSLPAWCPSALCSQASLCPAMGPPLGVAPVCELGLYASESSYEWDSNFGTRNLLGRRQALLCSPVLYQDGSTLLSAGFLGSASEHCVFTHWVLCSLTCMLQNKPLLICGSGKGAG